MRSFAKGGSTITQQLAKNLFLVQSRTLARKLEETVLAWRLSTLLDKKRLLEIYLNIIELARASAGCSRRRGPIRQGRAALAPHRVGPLAALTPNRPGWPPFPRRARR
jgi:monofunctional biosynthetic peptidoglycan transglycosylase